MWASDPKVAVTVTVEVPVGTGVVTVPDFEPAHPPNARLTRKRDSIPPLMERNLMLFFLFRNTGQIASSSVIRPLDDHFGGAVLAVNSLAENGLFVGQSNQFLQALMGLAQVADAALHG